MRSLQKDGQVTDFETSLRRKDGSLVTVLDSARTITLMGEPCILSVAHDFSERKHAEEALRASEERYHGLFRDAAVGIFHSTFEGRFIDVNLALAALLGYGSPEEVVRRLLAVSNGREVGCSANVPR